MERAGIVYLEAQHDLADRLDRLAAQARPATIDLVAIEDINSPGGHARGRGGHLINPRYLLAAAVQAGVAIQWAHAAGLDVVIVPPAGNGGAPADAYPAALRGAKTGKARHARSAFDVALGGAALARWTP